MRDEHGAEVSLSTVTRAVARLRREFAAERDEAFMDLVWHPGEAQADFVFCFNVCSTGSAVFFRSVG